MKDNPLGNTTLWLDSKSMEIARERFFKAWLASMRTDVTYRQWHTEDGSHVEVTQSTMSVDDARRTWDIAWAAAIAAHSFILEGRLGPPGDDDH
jgi:hypothetical protein